MKDYLVTNKKAYDLLAKEYEKRTIDDDYEIKDDYWYKMLNKLITKQGLNVLEIGPGSGRNLKMFDILKCDTVGVELSPKMGEVAKKWSPNSKIITGNILECNFEKDSFDIIFIMAVIHNFPLEDATELIRKIHLWLKKDGYLIIGTTIHDTENKGIMIKDDYNKKVGRYRYQYTKESFENLVISNNFKIFDYYIVSEKDRNKTWYDLICTKK